MENRVIDLAAFNAERESLRGTRDAVALRVSSRVRMLRDPRTRGGLLRDAIGDALEAWGPMKQITGILRGKGGHGGWIRAAASVAQSLLGNGAAAAMLLKGLGHLFSNDAAEAKRRRRSDLFMVLSGAALMLIQRLAKRESRAAEEESVDSEED